MTFAACGTEEPPKQNGEFRVLRFGYPSEPPTLDPLAPAGVSAATRDILRPTLPALFALDEKLQPKPELADGWPAKRDITTNPFTVKVKLREATWSDAKPITAADVRFSWEKLRAGPTGYRYRYLTNVDVVGRRTVRLRFSKPMRRWWSLFSLDDMVLPAHAYTHAWKDKPTVSGGPFTIKEWTKGLKVSMVRNESYWDKAHVGAMDVFFVPEDEIRLKLLDRRELDAFFAPGDPNMGRRAAAYGFKRTNKELGGDPGASGGWASAWWEIDLDTTRIGSTVAAAIGRAIDPALAAEIFEDSGQIADGIPRRFPVPGPKSEQRPPIAGPWAGRGSRDLAKRTLTSSREQAGELVKRGGQIIVSMAADRDSAGAQLAAFVHFRLLPLHIRAELTGLDTADFENLVASQQRPPAIIRLRRGSDAPDASSYVFGKLGSAETATGDVTAAETTASPELLRSRPLTGLDAAAWASAQRDLADAHAVYPLVRARMWIVGRGVAGPRAIGTSSGPFWNAATWRFD